MRIIPNEQQSSAQAHSWQQRNYKNGDALKRHMESKNLRLANQLLFDAHALRIMLERRNAELEEIIRDFERISGPHEICVDERRAA